MSNLPDDWDAYWRTCPDCDTAYHMSGTTECACERCESCNANRSTSEHPTLCQTCAETIDEEEEP